jgi:hypothetical protein
MTEKEYEELQIILQAFSYIQFSNKVRYQNKQKAKQIEENIEAYKREASRFRMISTEIMSKFAKSRLGSSKLQEVINIYNSLMHRLVFPGDFPKSASNYAHYILSLLQKILQDRMILNPASFMLTLKQPQHQNQVIWLKLYTRLHGLQTKPS